jgi:hypothetical protein
MKGAAYTNSSETIQKMDSSGELWEVVRWSAQRSKGG